MDLLPEELLADILRHLPPRPIAVCRTVSKGLRAVIDSRGLLLRGLRGIFINCVGQDEPYFFSRPERVAPRVDAGLRFLPDIGWREAVHHCNGLLLVQDWEKLYVCNPTTQRWAQLPPRCKGFGDAEHHVFDPTVSLHYEVIAFAEAPRKPKIPIQPDIQRPSWHERCRYYTQEEIQNLPSALRAKYDREAEIKGLAEWPPSSYAARVFSSKSGRWDERVYVREDDVTVTLTDVWSDPWWVESETLTYHAPRCNAVCWRGAFYIHCRGGFIIRLSPQEHKYQVIKTPRLDNIFTPPRLDADDYLRQEEPYWDKEACLAEFEMDQELLNNRKPSMHLGKSEHGIYYTALGWHQLRVWVLHEASDSNPILEWELKHKTDIKPSFLQHYLRKDRKKAKKSWSLDRGTEGSDDRIDYGWDSSDYGVTNVEREDDEYDDDDRYCDMRDDMDFLGYHPSKEIAFLGNGFDGFAYYLGTSKLQYLGTFFPVGCCHSQVAATHESFIYTPCMDDLLPDNT
ncbi:unnamed protein product [Urochloa decumbens]|uniref:F-box domain-containing protein n=1 Tax=Urochloa decumbens TaxID=240449 RepID=A0ABC9FNQ3_9POAL